jgi:hypothetical protein
MRRVVALLLLAGLLIGCGATPEPTVPPPTQTPWIIVVTATPGAESVGQLAPTQTPWIVTATPTRPKAATAAPTASAGTEATPTAGAEGTPVQATPTPRPPTPTHTPEPASLKYPPPVLHEPPDGVRVEWKHTVKLEWEPVGVLAQDEYYRLELDRPPTAEGMVPYGDWVFVKEPEYVLQGSFLAPFHPPEAQGEGTVYWWVRVVRKTGEDENGKPIGVDISAPSERRTLILEPKPADA